MKLPKHLTLCIDHNPHKNYYETIQQHMENFDHYKDCITAEDLAICIERDELWRIQWYPRNPGSFELVMSYSLERCLERAGEICDN